MAASSNRKLRIFALLLAAVLALSLHQAAAAVAVLGTATSISANTDTTLTFGTGESLVVRAATATSVTLSLETSLSLSLPSGFTAITAVAGYKLATTGGVALTKATFTSRALGLTGSASARVLMQSDSQQAYGEVTASYSTGTKKVTVELPSVGVYALATASGSAMIPTLYSQERSTTGGSYSNMTFPEGFVLRARTTSNNAITVTRSTFNSKPAQGSIGMYLSIEMDSKEDVTATLSYTYDASISAAVAQKLRFAYYDTSSSAWVTMTSGFTVDASARVITQTTTHFSDWTVRNGEGKNLEAGNQELSTLNPSRCYGVDFQSSIGVLRAEVTKTSTNGAIRMYLNKGDNCPSPTSHHFQTDALSDLNAEGWIEVTGDTDPSLSKGVYAISVYRESTGTGSVSYELEVSNPLFASSAASVAISMAVAVAALLAAMASMWM